MALRFDPIFIIGAPRSGTTLLRAMLNRHPNVGLCDETYYFYYVYSRRHAFGDLNKAAHRRRLVDRYLATNRIKRLGLDLDFLAVKLMDEGDSYESLFASLIRSYAVQNGKKRPGEKTPDHAIVSETLCEWYPDCRLIHLIRDPRDVVASLQRMPWASRSVLANARHWLRNTMSAHRCDARANYLLVRYEELVTQPERELERICAFIDEDYSAGMLTPDERRLVDKWWFERAQRNIAIDQQGKWHTELTPKQVGLVEWLIGSQMEQFGYNPTGTKVSRTAISAALADEVLAYARGKLSNLPTIWYYWARPTRLAEEEAWGRVP